MRNKHRKKRVLKSNETPDWLKSIQLNSWEAELLVSALLLYVLFQVPESLEIYFRKSIQPGNLLGGFANSMIKGIKLIRLGYSLHILIRGIWVATIGMSYVFPDGLSRKKLRFKGKFDRELENHEKLDGFVLTLERLASTIYGISFMLFGLYLGTFCMLFVIAIVSEFGVTRAFANDNNLLAVFSASFMIVYMGGIAILFLDFATNGLLRRDRGTAKWFYYVAVFFRVITLSILYRRSMLVIISNLPRLWRRLLPFLLVAVVFSYWYLDQLRAEYHIDQYYDKPAGYILQANYESQRSYGDLTRVTIPDMMVTAGAMEVFLRDIGLMGSAYKKQPGIKFTVKWDDMSPSVKNEFLQKLVLIDVDGKYELQADWLESKNKFDFTHGYYGFLDISEIPKGLHTLNLRINQPLLDSLRMTDYDVAKLELANIPFYLDKP